MFSDCGVPRELNNILYALQADVQEQKCNIKKEKEIIQSLESELERKKDGVKLLRESTKELDVCVKQLHSVYLNQRSANLRARESISLIDEQILNKKKYFQNLQDKDNEFRDKCEHDLSAHEETFKRYMKIYETFPHAAEYTDVTAKLKELQTAECEIKQDIQTIEQEMKMMAETENTETLRFPCVNAWAVQLAKKYVKVVNQMRSKENMLAEITRIEKNLEAIEKQKMEMEKKKIEKRTASKTKSTANADPQTTSNHRSKFADFFRRSTDFKDFFKFDKKPTPFRACQGSEPDIKMSLMEERTGDKIEKCTIEGKSKSTTSTELSRCQSMSALNKGSSGSSNSAVFSKRSNNLEQWLSTQGLFERKECRGVSKSSTPTKLDQDTHRERNATMGKGDQKHIRHAEDNTAMVGADLSQGPSKPNVHFDLMDTTGDDSTFEVCEPPSETDTNMDCEDSSLIQMSVKSPFKMTSPSAPGKDQGNIGKDFDFAVPLGPPPARKDRHSVSNRLHSNYDETTRFSMNFSDSPIPTTKHSSAYHPLNRPLFEGFEPESPQGNNNQSHLASSPIFSTPNSLSSPKFSFGDDYKDDSGTPSTGYESFDMFGGSSISSFTTFMEEPNDDKEAVPEDSGFHNSFF